MYINIYPSPDLLVIEIPEMSSLNNNSISLLFHSIKISYFSRLGKHTKYLFFIILIDDPNLTLAPTKTNLANNLHFFFSIFSTSTLHAKYPTILSNYISFCKNDPSPNILYQPIISSVLVQLSSLLYISICHSIMIEVLHVWLNILFKK